FYTGSVPVPSQGHLIVGSFADHRLHDLALDTTDGTSVLNETVLATAPEGILDVEMGLDGYLWVTTPSVIYRLVPAPVPAPNLPGLAMSTAGFAASWFTLTTPVKTWSRDQFRGGNTHHPGNLSRGRGVSAARCRRIEFRTTRASGNPWLGS
ncbi:MAG: hypothetical protein ACREDF_04680, partial [Thermoplasmata archaeon]